MSATAAMFARAVLQLPAAATLQRTIEGECLARAMQAAMDSLRTANVDFETLPTWLRQSDEKLALRHRLSDHWLARRPDNERDQTARPWSAERDAGAHACSHFTAAVLSDPLLFAAALRRTAAMVLNEPQATFRTRAVRVSADRDGTAVEFCRHQDVAAALEALRCWIAATQSSHAVTAVVAYAAVLNAHPFMDGNGRCGRALFNALANTGLATPAVFPLRALVQASDGGFEIFVRDAEINGNWQGLLSWFTRAFEVLQSFARGRNVHA